MKNRAFFAFIVLLPSLLFGQGPGIWTQTPQTWVKDGTNVNFAEGNVYFRSPTNLTYPSWIIHCWGDSITEGSTPAPYTYPADLATMLERSTYNHGVSGYSSTQIKTAFLASNATNEFHIFWAGYINQADTNTVMSDYADMVATLGQNKNFLVLSVLNNSSQTNDTAGYTNLILLNQMLQATYGEHYRDIRAWLVSRYDPGTPQDVIDYGFDIFPSSFRYDTVHPNSNGAWNIALYLSNEVKVLERSLARRPVMVEDIPSIMENIKGNGDRVSLRINTNQMVLNNGLLTIGGSATSARLLYVNGKAYFYHLIEANVGVSTPYILDPSWASAKVTTDQGEVKIYSGVALTPVEYIRVFTNGNVGIRTTAPSDALDINSTAFRLRNPFTVTNSTDAGLPGQIRMDTNYIYYCYATNLWGRVAWVTNAWP